MNGGYDEAAKAANELLEMLYDVVVAECSATEKEIYSGMNPEYKSLYSKIFRYLEKHGFIEIIEEIGENQIIAKKRR